MLLFTEVRSARLGFQSRASQAASANPIPRVNVSFRICSEGRLKLTAPLSAAFVHDPMEEIALGAKSFYFF